MHFTIKPLKPSRFTPTPLITSDKRTLH